MRPGDAPRSAPGHPGWLAHERLGDGPPLVLIHGLGSHWQVWRPLLDEVARYREVIALDLPGFGASPRWPEPPAGDRPGSVAHLADRVAAFLDALGLDRPQLAGSSLGGGVALELGRRGRARSVTAFAPVGFWDRPGRRWCRWVLGAARAGSVALAPVLPRLVAGRAGRVALGGAFYARPGRLSPADCLAAASALAGAPGFAAARDALPDRSGPGETPARLFLLDRSGPVDAPPGLPLPDVSGPADALAGVPVTIAWGTRDLVLPYRTQARRARAALPAARHVALRGCGHLPFADDPATCAALLTDRQ